MVLCEIDNVGQVVCDWVDVSNSLMLRAGLRQIFDIVINFEIKAIF